MALGLLAGCGGADRPPPPPLRFDGLPVSGSLADARKAGFDRCIADTIDMRCRRDKVMLLGQGPYSAALDLVGSDGGGGFDQLILWHDWDQNAVLAIAAALERQGWRSCYTGEGNRGDQAIYTRDHAPVRISMDISYWGKRRLRVIPEKRDRATPC
jgi:hypothetical protein